MDAGWGREGTEEDGGKNGKDELKWVRMRNRWEGCKAVEKFDRTEER